MLMQRSPLLAEPGPEPPSLVVAKEKPKATALILPAQNPLNAAAGGVEWEEGRMDKVAQHRASLAIEVDFCVPHHDRSIRRLRSSRQLG